MSLEERFKEAAKDVANFKTVEDDVVFALFYSLFKQATAGDCTEAQPQGTDSRSVSKHKAWVGLKGTSKEKAMETYLQKYTEMRPKYAK